jgi:hypothetical protein
MFLVCGRNRSEAGWKRSPCRVAVLQVEAFQDGLEVVLLRDVEFPCSTVPVDVETQKISGWSRVRAFELGIELAFEVVKCGPIVASDELVVDVNREHEEFVSSAARVETGVCLGWSETLRL